MIYYFTLFTVQADYDRHLQNLYFDPRQPLGFHNKIATTAKPNGNTN